MEIFQWFTDMGNTKPLALVMFFVTFVSIIVYVYFNKERSKRFESYRFIPLADKDDEYDEKKSNE